MHGASFKTSFTVGMGVLLFNPHMVVTGAVFLQTLASVYTQTRHFCCIVVLLPVLFMIYPTVFVNGLNFLELH